MKVLCRRSIGAVETMCGKYVQGDFFDWSRPKSIGDGKVPTKKVKVLIKFSHFLCDIPLLSLLW